MLSTIFKQLMRRKLITGITLLIIGGGYFGYQSLVSSDSAVQYVTATAEKGTLVLSISGSGQVSVSDQVDIKPKVSGDVTWIGVAVGQDIGQGQAILSIDDTDAKKAVADAELDLEEAMLQFDKDIAQAPIDYARTLESLQKAKDNLEKEYEDTFNTVSNAFLDLPSIITGTQKILFGIELRGSSQWNISAYKGFFDREDNYLIVTLADIAEKDYRTAREMYDENFLNFKDITRYSSESVIEGLLQETLDTSKSIAQAAKTEINLLDTIIDIAEQRYSNPYTQSVYVLVAGFQSDLRSYLGTTNSNLSSLLAQKRSLQDTKESIVNIERDISVLVINNPTGINPIDLQIAQNSIKKREVALADLKAELADYIVRAPFSGIIANIDAKSGDSVSSSTTLATLITKQKIAEVTLNEIDVAQVKIGQLATLTFNAVEEVTLTGKVIEIDALGTVTQGVVTYNVKIAFDTQDERIKPGMTIDASIITERKDSIVLVPNAAVKMQGGQVFVEVMQNEVPQIVPVEVGLSNELFTEIVNGLQEGAQVVTARLEGGGSAQTANVGQSFRFPGLGGGGGSFRGGFQQH